MAKPRRVQWEKSGHTEAKHAILVAYLDAWIPILARSAKDLVIIDGFAGPGRYEDGSAGSPLLMIDAYARRADRAKLCSTLHFYFIEAHEARFSALQDQLAKRKPADDIDVQAIHGRYEDEFPRALSDATSRFGSPPIFAFIDPFGGKENRLDLSRQLLQLPRCEALIFVPLQFFARHVENPDLDRTLDSLYGSPVWRQARKEPGLEARLRMLHDLFAGQLRTSCDYVRSFELVPLRGGNSHFLFFGTNNEVGLARMKAAMWKMDPVGGRRFKDSTLAGAPVLFEPEPDTRPLLDALRIRFGEVPFSIEDAERFTLIETPFMHDAHLKSRTLRPAEKIGDVEFVDGPPGRKRGFYPPKTRLRFRR